MIFHMRNTKLTYIPALSINGIGIERVPNFNFLGLTINENLSWKAHSDKIAIKISKACGILNRLKHFLPQHIMRIIYCSLVQSNLNYSLLAWGYDYNRVVKLQKKIIRIICCSTYNAHTEPLFKGMRLLKVEDIFKINVLKFYYKLQHGKLPNYFKSYQPRSQVDIHGRDTRYGFLFPTNVTRMHLSQKCLRNTIPNVLNSTPPFVLEKIHTHSYHGVSNYIKNKMINDYSYECHIENCHTCGN